MNRIVCLFPVAVALAVCGSSTGQVLVVDRGVSPDGLVAEVRLGRTTPSGFIGDHFQIGKRNEVWIIDNIRIWVAADPHGRTTVPTEALGEATLFGGLETPNSEPGRQPEPECDCHNLMIIKTGRLNPVAARAGDSDPLVSLGPGGIPQVDFGNLHWSIPGGVPIQFGIRGAPLSASHVWYNEAGEVGGTHELKTFDERGKLEGPYLLGGSPVDQRIGLNVQVWAHRFAPVSVRSSGALIEVVLRSDASFDAGKADPTTLRFGPHHAAAASSEWETSERREVLVVRFPRAAAGVQGANVSACLTGRQLDGVPFEGCDLVASK